MSWYLLCASTSTIFFQKHPSTFGSLLFHMNSRNYLSSFMINCTWILIVLKINVSVNLEKSHMFLHYWIFPSMNMVYFVILLALILLDIFLPTLCISFLNVYCSYTEMLMTSVCCVFSWQSSWIFINSNTLWSIWNFSRRQSYQMIMTSIIIFTSLCF